MKILKLFVEGVPKAQPRPRACIRGRHAGVFDPGTADDWKLKVSMKVCTAAKEANWTRTDAPVKLCAWFVLPRPKSHFYASKKRAGELKESAPTFVAAKPDLDNYVKAVMDAITDFGDVWFDDSQVVKLEAAKTYCEDGNAPGAHILIIELERGGNGEE